MWSLPEFSRLSLWKLTSCLQNVYKAHPGQLWRRKLENSGSHATAHKPAEGRQVPLVWPDQGFQSQHCAHWDCPAASGHQPAAQIPIPSCGKTCLQTRSNAREAPQGHVSQRDRVESQTQALSRPWLTEFWQRCEGSLMGRGSSSQRMTPEQLSPTRERRSCSSLRPWLFFLAVLGTEPRAR